MVPAHVGLVIDADGGAEDFHHVAGDRDVGAEVGDVDGDEVHRDAADDGHHPAAEGDLAAEAGLVAERERR